MYSYRNIDNEIEQAYIEMLKNEQQYWIEYKPVYKKEYLRQLKLERILNGKEKSIRQK